MSDITFDMEHNKMTIHDKRAESWTVTLIDTGDESMTGGRLLRVKSTLRMTTIFVLHTAMVLAI